MATPNNVPQTSDASAGRNGAAESTAAQPATKATDSNGVSAADFLQALRGLQNAVDQLGSRMDRIERQIQQTSRSRPVDLGPVMTVLARIEMTLNELGAGGTKQSATTLSGLSPQAEHDLILALRHSVDSAIRGQVGTRKWADNLASSLRGVHKWDESRINEVVNRVLGLDAEEEVDPSAVLRNVTLLAYSLASEKAVLSNDMAGQIGELTLELPWADRIYRSDSDRYENALRVGFGRVKSERRK